MPLKRSPVPLCNVIHRPRSNTGLLGAVEEFSGVISSSVMILEERHKLGVGEVMLFKFTLLLVSS